MKRFVFQQELIDATVYNVLYEKPGRFGVGLGTSYPSNWYLELEATGKAYSMLIDPLSLDFDPRQLAKGDKVRIRIARFFGIPIYYTEIRRL